MSEVLTGMGFAPGDLRFMPLAPLVALDSSATLSFVLDIFPAHDTVRRRPFEGLQRV